MEGASTIAGRAAPKAGAEAEAGLGPGPGGEPSETADMTFMNETIALQINLLVGGLLVLNNPKSTTIFESQLTVNRHF